MQRQRRQGSQATCTTPPLLAFSLLCLAWHCALSLTLSLLSAFLTLTWSTKALRAQHLAILHKDSAILVKVLAVSLAVEAHDGEAAGAAQDGVCLGGRALDRRTVSLKPCVPQYTHTHTHTHTITEGNAAEGRGQRAEGRGLCPLHDRVPCSSCQLCWCT